MQQILDHFVAGAVKGQGSLNYYGKRRDGSAIIRGTDDQYAWRDQVKSSIAMSLPPDYISVPKSVPVAVDYIFVFARPKTHYRANGELKDWASEIYFNLTGIDIDKCERLINDALTQSTLITDDKQVVMERAERIYTNDINFTPGVHMKVWRLDD